jgi:SSS family solute:Na+ symporter
MELSQQTLCIILLVVYFVILMYVVTKSSDNKNSVDYFLAGRKLPFWALSITFIASWWGGGSAVDLVDHAFRQGISSYWIYGMPVLFSVFLMYLFAKSIRRIGTITQPQLVEKRYDKKVSLALSVLILIFMILTTASQIVVIGNFFLIFFHISYVQAAVLGTGIVLLYSVLGGFKGVVITDIVQFVFLLIASVAIFVYAYINSGGFGAIETIAQERNIDGVFSLTKNLGTNIAYVITFGSAWMIQANIWQRISATKTPKDAKNMMILSFFAFIPLYLIVTLTGVLSLGMYETVPVGGLVPAIITDYMHPVFGALIFVGITSAVMSTMDSLINTGALVLSLDLYQERINPSASPKHMVVVGKLATVIVTLIAVIIALYIKSVLEISWIAADFIATGAFVPIILGFLWKRGNSWGALASVLFGIIFPLYNLLSKMGIDVPICWDIGSTKQAIIGMGGSFVIYVAVSLLTRQEYSKASKFMKVARGK